MDLYLSTSSINWVNQFHSSKRFVVDFNGTNREIRNSQYGAMKVKDGIVDCFEKKGLPRPNISKERPDIRVHVRLHKDKAILGVDMVGSGLHQRGYRPESGRAPLRETLAAAIIMRCGWDGHQPLLDPMCGSGTLLIEAAMMAANMAPGVKRSNGALNHLKTLSQIHGLKSNQKQTFRLDAVSRKLTLSFLASITTLKYSKLHKRTLAEQGLRN